MCHTDLQQNISRASFSHQIERVLFRASFSCEFLVWVSRTSFSCVCHRLYCSLASLDLRWGNALLGYNVDARVPCVPLHSLSICLSVTVLLSVCMHDLLCQCASDPSVRVTAPSSRAIMTSSSSSSRQQVNYIIRCGEVVSTIRHCRAFIILSCCLNDLRPCAIILKHGMS